MTLAVFRYSNSQNEAITPPTLAWDGRYPIKTDSAYTLINVLELQKTRCQYSRSGLSRAFKKKNTGRRYPR